jgi:hypothetical protein
MRSMVGDCLCEDPFHFGVPCALRSRRKRNMSSWDLHEHSRYRHSEKCRTNWTKLRLHSIESGPDLRMFVLFYPEERLVTMVASPRFDEIALILCVANLTVISASKRTHPRWPLTMEWLRWSSLLLHPSDEQINRRERSQSRDNSAQVNTCENSISFTVKFYVPVKTWYSSCIHDPNAYHSACCTAPIRNIDVISVINCWTMWRMGTKCKLPMFQSNPTTITILGIGYTE